MFCLVFLLPCSIVRAQKVEVQMSPKPAITVNGNNCSIWNTIWSCVTRVCDSVVINAGDSVEFCTSTEVYLNTDTAYWIEWNFPGSNYPDSIYHHYPYQTPHCIYARWDVPGDYYCDIYYNGWLSAYPNSDCYPTPSHWIVHIIVLPDPNGIAALNNYLIRTLPNPSNGIFKLENIPANAKEVIVTDMEGKEMLRSSRVDQVDLSAYESGIYFLQIVLPDEVLKAKLVKE